MNVIVVLSLISLYRSLLTTYFSEEIVSLFNFNIKLLSSRLIPVCSSAMLTITLAFGEYTGSSPEFSLLSVENNVASSFVVIFITGAFMSAIIPPEVR